MALQYFVIYGKAVLLLLEKSDLGQKMRVFGPALANPVRHTDPPAGAIVSSWPVWCPAQLPDRDGS